MRSITRNLGLATGAMALTALTALVGSGAADAAPAGTESMYAPSALVVSVTAGADADRGTVLRAVTLVCAPRPSGTHPDPVAACAELRANGRALDALAEPRADAACTREWNPMTVTADGVWEGRRLSYTYTFGNPCGLRNSTGVLFGI
ncbi:subtilase-type protease inhibitor [Streptomyces sp. NPDC060334]|uniref:subtilase-type protease inhibitor n=1 Tax=unclassified Streptomyces TaxID=2593676 RepID=UPI0006AE4BE8|nr:MULTISPECIES: subtilase-type protease inhibitor [unclassified Streptomyces]KOU42309.1 alkaline protease inhibitor [Streptomyces sp. WM4235]MCX5077009.1 subtilase-type protease inhibitor [Streptomyces sp. NBC_00424]WUD39988.1 subtilase-type protease inhibitor [Streptomyces sp. NBC_00513]